MFRGQYHHKLVDPSLVNFNNSLLKRSFIMPTADCFDTAEIDTVEMIGINDSHQLCEAKKSDS